MRTNKAELQKLKAYTKDDIIEALGRCYQSGYIVSTILGELEERKAQNAIKEHEKAIDMLNSARTVYMSWRNDMCVKYGDGKTVKIANIPPTEISQGALLEKALNTATERERKISKEVDKILKVGVVK